LKKTPKHIAIVVNYFPTVSETFIVNQINSLLEAGLHVSLYAYNQVNLSVIHDSFSRYQLLDKVHYFIKPPVSKCARFGSFLQWTFKNIKDIKWSLYFRTLNFFKYGKDAYTLKLFFESQWFLVTHKTDLIHAHFGMVGNRVAYLKAQQILPDSVALITTFHGYDLAPNKLLKYKKNYRYLFAKGNAFTVNTPYLEGLLQQVLENKKPCYILPVGLDTRFFRRESIIKETKNTSFNLVFCGKLIRLKGPDLAILIVKALHDLGYTETHLHIIGDGVLFSALQQQIVDLQLEAFVTLYGKQTQEQIKNIFAASDVFVLPGRIEEKTGRAETQGLVIQEAQAMTLPVIVSNVGGMKYGLLPNQSGFVVQEEDVAGFAAAIEKIILNPSLKKTMGEKGKEFVAQYDNVILLEKLLYIYKEILSDHKNE